MKIEIRRYQIKGEACDSHLYIDNCYVCDCAEHAAHMVPEGRYSIVLRYSRLAKRKVPTLIPPADGYRVLRGRFPTIGMGNGIYNLRHSQILVGTYLVPGVLTRSYAAFLPLYNRINKALLRGRVVNVEVKM